MNKPTTPADNQNAPMAVASGAVLGQLRVWWIPQVPMKSFNVDVANVHEAKLLLKALADYDIFQFENNVKPDYCNAGGLQMWDGKEWEDWHDEEGNDIDETQLA